MKTLFRKKKLSQETFQTIFNRLSATFEDNFLDNIWNQYNLFLQHTLCGNISWSEFTDMSIWNAFNQIRDGFWLCSCFFIECLSLLGFITDFCTVSVTTESALFLINYFSFAMTNRKIANAFFIFQYSSFIVRTSGFRQKYEETFILEN